MQRLEALAALMLSDSSKYEQVLVREQQYAEKMSKTHGITVEEFIRRTMSQRVRTMMEECVFDESEDIIIFADSWQSFNFESDKQVEENRAKCRAGHCHRHEFFEMFYVLKGFCYNYIDGHEKIFREGSVCLYNCQASHARILPDGESIILTMCVRRQAFETSLLSLLSETPIFWQFFATSTLSDDTPPAYIHLEGAQNYELESLFFHLMRAYLLEDVASQTVMKCYFICLMSELARMRCVAGYRLDMNAGKTSQDETIDRIRTTIQSKCDRITLNELAAEYHFSSSYLSKYIKKHTGKTFQELLSFYWLEKAKTLLKCSTFSVDTISELMGASARSNFERRFKSLSHVSPAQYRQIESA